MRSSSARSLFLLLLASCEDPIDEPSDKDEFSCTLGALDDDGVFMALDGTAELVLGFQGFLTVPVALQADDPPGTVQARMQLDIDGGDKVAGEQSDVRFQGGVTEPILLFLTSDSIGEWKNRTGTLTVRVEDPTRYCIVSAAITLVDEDCDEDVCP